MFLKSINIEKFRSFKNLEIEEFKKINLLVGKNGYGKTSLLEAIFLLIGGTNPTLTTLIQNIRGMFVNTNNDFRYLFNDFRIDDINNNNIKFKATTSDNKETRLHIRPNIRMPEYTNLNNATDQNFVNNRDGKFAPKIIVKTSNELAGIHYEYFDSSDDKPFSIDYNIPTPTPISFRPRRIKGSYLNSATMPSALKSVGEFIISKSENELVSVLKEIDSDITGIKMGPDNTVYIDIEGKTESVPINIMGDGIINLISILASIRKIKNDILLIDEIESGLHFESLESLWKAVLKACQLYNVQIFATTHSYDCIRALSKIYNKDNETISLIRLDKRGDKHTAVTYTANELETAIENNMRIR
ncbi:MAG: AAA family ATPase [Endomicrobium sp.]|jgi:AAA15 family ATPase/GTPase|nr:AAA family ATPase [Endomicrobium sp.]